MYVNDYKYGTYLKNEARYRFYALKGDIITIENEVKDKSIITKINNKNGRLKFQSFSIEDKNNLSYFTKLKRKLLKNYDLFVFCVNGSEVKKSQKITLIEDERTRVHYFEYPNWLLNEREQGIFVDVRDFYASIPVKFEVSGRFSLIFSTAKEAGYDYITKVVINGKTVFKGIRPVSYYKRYNLYYEVKENEEYRIEVYRKLFSLRGFIKRFFIKNNFVE